MTDKEKIRAEVERLKDIQSSPIVLCNDLISFIDSLPEESVSKDLEILAKRICGYGFYDLDGTPREVIEKYLAIGANWQKERDVNKACEWLENNLADKTSVLCSGVISINFDNVLKEFRKAIEEEK